MLARTSTQTSGIPGVSVPSSPDTGAWKTSSSGYQLNVLTLSLFASILDRLPGFASHILVPHLHLQIWY